MRAALCDIFETDNLKPYELLVRASQHDATPSSILITK